MARRRCAGRWLFALGWFALRRRQRGRPVSLKTFVRAMFPRRILMHPSSWVDVRLWTLNTIVFASGYAWLVYRQLLLARPRHRRR